MSDDDTFSCRTLIRPGKQWRGAAIGAFWVLFWMGLQGAQPGSASPLASPLAPPTPGPNTINQPFVTFQRSNALQHLFRFDGGVPVFWTIVVLLFLLGLASFYIHSFRSRH